MHEIFPGWNGTWSGLAGLTPTRSNITWSNFAPVVGALLGVLAIFWIFLIISAFFNRRSLKMLSTKTSVGLFSTAGLMLLIGAVLTIVLVGAVLIWVAILLIAIAFYEMKPQPEQPVTAIPQS